MPGPVLPSDTPGDAAGFAQAVLAMLASPFAPEGCRTFGRGLRGGRKVMGELEGA